MLININQLTMAEDEPKVLVLNMEYDAYGHGDGYCSGSTNYSQKGTAKVTITSEELSKKTGVDYNSVEFTHNGIWRGALCSFDANYNCDAGGSGYCDEDEPGKEHAIIFRVKTIRWKKQASPEECHGLVALSSDIGREFHWNQLKLIKN